MAPSAANLLLCGHGPWSPTGQCVPAILGATQPVGLSQGKLWRQEQPLPLPCSWAQASPAIPKWRADRPTPAPNPGPLLPPQAEKRWRERQAGTAALSTAPPQCPETPTYSHLTGREQGLTAAHSPSDPAGLLPQPGEQEAGPQSVRETPPACGLLPPHLLQLRRDGPHQKPGPEPPRAQSRGGGQHPFSGRASTALGSQPPGEQGGGQGAGQDGLPPSLLTGPVGTHLGGLAAARRGPWSGRRPGRCSRTGS